MDRSLSFAEIVQPILTEERRLELWPRDIALLATIKGEIERSLDGLLTIPYSAIQGMSSRIDLLDVKDPKKAERRMSESMTRLLNAGCLTKAKRPLVPLKFAKSIVLHSKLTNRVMNLDYCINGFFRVCSN